MPLPNKRAVKKKAVPKKEPTPPSDYVPTEVPPFDILESTDINVIGGVTEVSLHVELKMSRDYQSGGASMGFKFKTLPAEAATSAKKGMVLLKRAVVKEMQEISGMVGDLG